MTRNLQSSGGPDHIELVKLTSKKIIDEFDRLRNIAINYEGEEFHFDLKIKETGYEGYTNANFEFRPDIVVRHVRDKFEEITPPYGMEPPWNSIFDSNFIAFEAETDPSNIFSNILKMAAYAQIKGRNNPIGRKAYAFVLVCWDDARLPENIEPFDIVWSFPRSSQD